ncbi:MAG: beta-ketoacyl-[acyl-carrier-protein] synthase family protein [Candidatus Omnitrophota bacterium]|nr:beta-ketoacyl-[acyl-carrier-protein] synthase family protein [Candidatus Omnitrophota bacterium]
MSEKRVVVTGLGIISSIGIGHEEFWRNLIQGKSGISRITSFDTSQYDRHYGGEVKNFHPQDFIDRRKIKNIGRASQLALAASKLALKDAGLKFKNLSKEKTGVCVGTTTAEAGLMEEMDDTWLKKGADAIDIKFVAAYSPYVIAINIANRFKLRGQSFLFSNACAAGNYSIGYAYDLIKAGRADVILTGGTDAFTRINLTGFSRLFAVAPEICQPFDKNRKGMLVGEGAGMLVLENLESALKRKANLYAEVLGYGLSCDAKDMTAASVEGVSRCIEKSLKAANIKPEQVDYINAHGTGTPTNDKVECAAIKKVFKNYKKIPVSSIKSMLGHTMGAAAAIEAIACCLTIKEGIIPPTINFKTPDPDCDIDCIPNKSRKQTVKIALNNSQAFGGNNACAVLRKI